MNRKKVIVTGAYGAIGTAISEGIARKGYALTLVGRDGQKLKRLSETLIRKVESAEVGYYALDLSRKVEVEDFANHWQGPLDILINNAAATPVTRMETPEGIELQFATNVLGYMWMMEFFHPFMKGREDARIVNVASYWAGDLDLEDLEFHKRKYNNDMAYRQSKQANRMLTGVWGEKLKDQNIAVLAAHPGDVNSKLSNNLGYGGWESPAQGAATPLFCALDESLRGVTSKYVEKKRITPCHFFNDKAASEKLFEICCRY